MSRREFNYDQLQENGADPNDAVWSEFVDSGRWYEFHNVVFRAEDDGKLYHVVYQRGLTESQELYGPEHYPDLNYTTKTVSCPEVELYDEIVPVTKYREIA